MKYYRLGDISKYLKIGGIMQNETETFFVLESTIYSRLYYSNSTLNLTADVLKANRYASLEEAQKALNSAPNLRIRKVKLTIKIT